MQIKFRQKFNPAQTLERQHYGKKGLSFSSVHQGLPEDHGTTHFSVMDKFGNVVAATETVNYYFGSQVIIPETGHINEQ